MHAYIYAPMHAGTGRMVYDLVLAARIDVVWFVPVVFGRLDAPAQLWLPGQCCRPDPGKM